MKQLSFALILILLFTFFAGCGNEPINAYNKYTANGCFTEAEMLRLISLKSRDNARTPMQWAPGPGAGFTAGAPWMDINPNHADINAEEQLARDDSVLAHYRALIALRHRYDVVIYGAYEMFCPEDPRVFAYTRTLDGDSLLVCCNFTDEPVPFAPPGRFTGPGAQQLLGNVQESTYMQDHILAPYEAVILLKEKER